MMIGVRNENVEGLRGQGFGVEEADGGSEICSENHLLH